jgi:hypothetical protein
MSTQWVPLHKLKHAVCGMSIGYVGCNVMSIWFFGVLGWLAQLWMTGSAAVMMTGADKGMLDKLQV